MANDVSKEERDLRIAVVVRAGEYGFRLTEEEAKWFVLQEADTSQRRPPTGLDFELFHMRDFLMRYPPLKRPNPIA